MIEIWTEFGRFKAANERLFDRVRTITKNSFLTFKYYKSTKIYRQTHQQIPTIVTETILTGKPEALNQMLHGNDPYIANTQTLTLTPEEKSNVEII